MPSNPSYTKVLYVSTLRPNLLPERLPMIRDDLSDRLIHLTRGAPLEVAATRFLQIMESQALLGGDGFIMGKYLCVCFSEAPIAKLSVILANPSANGMRYSPFGVMVSKSWLYAQGGRPVIYQAKEEYEHLPESLRYRHVTYDPTKGIDFTWEREWRILSNSLSLDVNAVTLVVPTRKWADKLRSDFESKDFRNSLQLGFKGMRISAFPWHFIALEDLGVQVPE
jgi:hypothetical protein